MLGAILYYLQSMGIHRLLRRVLTKDEAEVDDDTDFPPGQVLPPSLSLIFVH